jgi:hypothetical protein
MEHMLKEKEKSWAMRALFAWLKVLFADLLRKKNTVRWLKKYGL